MLGQEVSLYFMTASKHFQIWNILYQEYWKIYLKKGLFLTQSVKADSSSFRDLIIYALELG